MLYLCIFLLIVGVLALLLEIIMPGFDSFISGIVGVLALVASAVLAVVFVPGGWILVALNLTVLFIGCYIMYSYIRRQQFHGKLVLSDTLAEDLPPLDLASLVGKEGKTMTLLRPYGEVDFNGVRIEVSSNGPMIERGSRVRVIETQANKVVVSLVDGN